MQSHAVFAQHRAQLVNPERLGRTQPLERFGREHGNVVGTQAHAPLPWAAQDAVARAVLGADAAVAAHLCERAAQGAPAHLQGFTEGPLWRQPLVPPARRDLRVKKCDCLTHE